MKYSIYTRTGDSGTTGLGDGSRVAKDDLRIAALGDVDELQLRPRGAAARRGHGSEPAVRRRPSRRSSSVRAGFLICSQGGRLHWREWRASRQRCRPRFPVSLQLSVSSCRPGQCPGGLIRCRWTCSPSSTAHCSTPTSGPAAASMPARWHWSTNSAMRAGSAKHSRAGWRGSARWSATGCSPRTPARRAGRKLTTS